MSDFINFWASVQATSREVTVTIATSKGLTATATKYAYQNKMSVTCGSCYDDPDTPLDFSTMYTNVAALGGDGTEVSTGFMMDSDVPGFTESALAMMAYGLLLSLDNA